MEGVGLESQRDHAAWEQAPQILGHGLHGVHRFPVPGHDDGAHPGSSIGGPRHEVRCARGSAAGADTGLQPTPRVLEFILEGGYL